MNRKTSVFVLPWVLAACGASPPQPQVTTVPYQADSGSIAVRCGTLIDGIAEQPASDQLVVIRAGRFERIDAGRIGHSDGLPLLDLGEYTCMPGLINTHVHLMDKPEDAVDYGVYDDRTLEDHIQGVLEEAAANLLTGCTTVRNVGDFGTDPIYIGRDKIRSGTAIGPRVQTAGPYSLVLTRTTTLHCWTMSHCTGRGSRSVFLDGCLQRDLYGYRRP